MGALLETFFYLAHIDDGSSANISPNKHAPFLSLDRQTGAILHCMISFKLTDQKKMKIQAC